VTSAVRHGLVILPDLPWSEAAPRWRAAEELGFDHAWTYDHLVWADLPDSSWYGTMPTLTAAALSTSRIGLGTFVASPNFRHPVVLHRDVQALDDISAGRFLLGVGTGGDLDSAILGGSALTVGDRVARFHEFVLLLRRLRAEDHVDADGRWFRARDARTQPPVRDVPLLVAANGPRSVRFAADRGDGWITNGPRTDTLEAWFAGVARSRDILEEALARADRDGGAFPRFVCFDRSPRYSLESAGLYEELAGRAADLGFTDVVAHWPRAAGPYAGDETVLEQVAARVIGR